MKHPIQNTINSKTLFPFFFDSFFNDVDQACTTDAQCRPRDCQLNVYEEGNEVVVEAPLPGLKKDDLSISMHEGIVWIKGQKCEENTANEKSRKYYCKSQSSFSYRLALPTDVDETKEPLASFQNGVMTVRFQKQNKAQPKEIRIQ